MKLIIATLTALLLTALPASHAQQKAPPKGEPTNAREAATQKAAADKLVDERYAALVAKLPPEQQAWERVLQENLGGFYLPLHKRDKIAGRSNAWDFVQDDPKLPRVLLIGDSVSRGYTQATRKALAGKVNVHRAPENCGPTANGLKKIEIWLGDGKWDVIHFNFGIHDRATPIADYTQRLEQLIAQMKKTGAKLIWASTTPIPDDPAHKQTAASIVERNAAAVEVMKKHGVATDDLFAFITPHLAQVQNPNDVHFNGEGYDLLGKQVAAAIHGVLAIATAGEFWVAPAGTDVNPGTKDKPFASFATAQKVARQSKSTVWFRAGTYYLPETIVLSAEDAGNTFAAAPGETVILSGGTKLDLQWSPHKDGIMQAKTPAGLAIDQLFVNGKRQMMARYPNFNPNVLPYGGYSADAFGKERAARWADPTGGFIHAIQSSLWGSYSYRITGKDDKGEVTYAGGWQDNRPRGMHKQHRFVENIFEELDAPGEWFHNARTGTLYYYPPADVDLKTAAIEIVRLRHLVEFIGAKHVTLRGFIFRHAARTFMDTKEPLLRSDWAIYRGGALLFKGAEDCTVADCELDQVGGNAIFVSGYNRRIHIAGCDIHDTGASAVAFVGETNSVRNPLFDFKNRNNYAALDKTPGPKTQDYPADCVVEDCLIRHVGSVEKQVAGVELSMAMGITIRHCSIYDSPRSGINVSEGTFGGHRIEFCDVFDTVKETGDHGSFNSWGRDRYWCLNPGTPAAELPRLALLDVVKPIIIHNNRWRCDHGWDVDLDDGSTNYEIHNNLFLAGGLKLREGFHRKVWNNIAVNNSLHPHCWYENSGDEVTRNIWMGAYHPARMDLAQWGKEVDHNQFTSDADRKKFADKGCDVHSLTGDPMFVDPARGDFRVKDGSPALKLGFKNFPMDQFGVVKPSLKKIARTPEIPALKSGASASRSAKVVWLGATVKELEGEEYSAFGTVKEDGGIHLVEVPSGSSPAKAGLRVGDLIQGVNGKPVRTCRDLVAAMKGTGGKPVTINYVRNLEKKQATLTP